MTRLVASDVLRANIASHIATIGTLSDLAGPLTRAADTLGQALLDGNKLLTCGNGGSAADAAHLATEFVCRYNADRRPYPAIALTDAGSTLSAVGNDYAFEVVFARQVRAFGKEGDVLIAFTTSGNSRNVLLALEAARELRMHTIAFLGKTGGFTKGVADIELLVPAQVTARIQECHLLLYHCLCETVETILATGTKEK
jgi:D-sedoheptulose 7-phosphate isomerase